MKEKYERAI